MEKRPLVVLLGDSVLIDGVVASLRTSENLRVKHLDTPSAGVCERLLCLKPDLVVFELDSLQAPLLVSLIRVLAGTTLLGLDLTASRTIVVNSYPRTTHNMDQPAQIIQSQATQYAHAQKGGLGTINTHPVDILVGLNVPVTCAFVGRKAQETHQGLETPGHAPNRSDLHEVW